MDRFFTEIISNTVVLDDVRVFSGKGLRHVFDDGGPLRLLLHEKTHHASFDSRVGAALGSLSAWAGQHNVTSPDPDTLSLSQRDLLIVRSAYRVLEPLVEGLALFAEHDNVPGNSDVASAVTHAATTLIFGEPTEQNFDQLRTLLWHHRGLAPSAEEKTRLLAQPLTARPAYLLGYLAVKGLYWRLVSRCPRLVDTDLFILLMLDYWFRDSRLASRLLSFKPPAPPMVALAELLWIINYLEDRTDALVEHVDEYVDALVSYVGTSGQPVRFDSGEGPAYRNAGDGGALELYARLRATALANHSAAALFGFRSDFRFSSTPVTVEVSKDRYARITTRAGELAGERIPVVPNSAGGTFAGAIEGVMTPHLGGRVVFVISGRDGLVAVRERGVEAWNAPELVKHFDDFPSTIEVLEAMARLDADHNRTSEQDVVARELPRFETIARDAAQHIYLKWALPAQSPMLREPLAAALAEKGFAGPLSEASLLDTLGRVSVRCGCHVWEMTTAAVAQGWDAGAVAAELDEINRQLHPLLGLDAIVMRDGKVSSLL